MKVNLLPNESILRKLRVLVLIGLAMFVLSHPALAQGATTAKLTTIKTVIQNIVNVLFVIGVIYGLIRVVMAFIGQKEGGMTSLLWLVIAIIVWVCFNLFMTDIGITSATGVGGK